MRNYQYNNIVIHINIHIHYIIKKSYINSNNVLKMYTAHFSVFYKFNIVILLSLQNKKTKINIIN